MFLVLITAFAAKDQLLYSINLPWHELPFEFTVTECKLLLVTVRCALF